MSRLDPRCGSQIPLEGLKDDALSRAGFDRMHIERIPPRNPPTLALSTEQQESPPRPATACPLRQSSLHEFARRFSSSWQPPGPMLQSCVRSRTVIRFSTCSAKAANTNGPSWRHQIWPLSEVYDIMTTTGIVQSADGLPVRKPRTSSRMTKFPESGPSGASYGGENPRPPEATPDRNPDLSFASDLTGMRISVHPRHIAPQEFTVSDRGEPMSKL